MKRISLLLAFAFISTAQARDLGYRYVNGACVDAKGKAGMNPGFVGPCGDLRGVIVARFNFDDSDLSGADFSSADVQESSFKGTRLAGTKFVGTNLAGAQFENADLDGTDFTRSSLINAHLVGAKFKNVNFSGVDLSGAPLSYLELQGCRLSGAKLVKAVLDHADLSKCDLSGADLTDANFASTRLDGANLQKSDLTRTDLGSASLVKADATEAKMRRTTMRRAVATGAHFNKAFMINAQLDGADIRRAVFKGADLRAASLQNAQTDGTNFSTAKYSKRTILPFSQDDAKKLGMVVGTGGSLLVILDSADIDLNGLKTFLDGEGVDLTVSQQRHAAFDGKLSLSEYSSILHILGTDYDTEMPAGGQTAIMKFVRDGGVYMATQWSGYAFQFRNNLKMMDDLILFTFNSTTTADLKYVPVAQKATHPVLEGIKQFTVTGFHTQSPLRSMTGNPVEALIVDDGGSPILAVRDVGSGHSVNFGIAPERGSKVFNTPGLERLILNAVNWQ